MVMLPGGKKIEDMFSGVDRIPACDRRTDIFRQHSPRYGYASRGITQRCKFTSAYVRMRAYKHIKACMYYQLGRYKTLTFYMDN